MSGHHWTIRELILAAGYELGILLLITGIAVSLFVQPASAHEGTVTPVILCVTHDSNGAFTAIWGYRNDTDRTIRIPIGSKNFVKPDAKNGHQPVEFKPGHADDVFETSFHEDQVIRWTIVGPDGAKHTAQARDNTQRCRTTGGKQPTQTHTQPVSTEIEESPTVALTPLPTTTMIRPPQATSTGAVNLPPAPTTSETAVATSLPTGTSAVPPTVVATSLPPAPTTAATSPATSLPTNTQTPSVTPAATETATSTSLPTSAGPTAIPPTAAITILPPFPTTTVTVSPTQIQTATPVATLAAPVSSPTATVISTSLPPEPTATPTTEAATAMPTLAADTATPIPSATVITTISAPVGAYPAPETATVEASPTASVGGGVSTLAAPAPTGTSTAELAPITGEDLTQPLDWIGAAGRVSTDAGLVVIGLTGLLQGLTAWRRKKLMKK